MEALRGSVLKGRSPQEVAAEVRALQEDNQELRKEVQEAAALAADNSALRKEVQEAAGLAADNSALRQKLSEAQVRNLLEGIM
jgi:hypothetical protein